MDINTCKVALELAAKYMTPAKLALYTKALRTEWVNAEIATLQKLRDRKVQPVQEYKALNAQLPVLQQQLAAL